MTAPVLTQKKFWIVKPSAGRNYVKNPQPYSSTGGYSVSGGTIASDGTNSRRGPGCIKVSPNTGVPTIVSYSGLTGTSGLAYSFSLDVLGVAGQAMRIYVSIGGVPQGKKTITATGYWQRISLSFIANTTGAVVLSLQRDSIASTAPFWTDGWQFEQAVKPSTFISGDLGEGYYWEGLPRDSASTRMNYVKTGGELLDLEDYCQLVQVTGLGHGDWNQILTKMTSGGDLYQGHIRKSRQFSIIVDFIGETLGEIEANRKALIDAIRPDLFEGEMVVRYQGFDDNGNEATNPIDILCVPLPATLTDTPDLPNHQRAIMNFEIPSGLLDGAYEEGGELDLYAEFAANYIVRRDPQGNWCKWNGTKYVNPLAGVDGAVYDIKEAPNGDIYVCGRFDSAGGVTGTYRIARWSKANQAWQGLGVTSANSDIEIIYCMAFDANGDLYVGGDFNNIAGIFGANYFAKYNVSTGIWSKVGSGIAGPAGTAVEAIEISSEGTIYIGGSFSQAGGNTNCKNIAYYNGTNWAPLLTGLNNVVFALKFAPDGRLIIGGNFTNADGANGDFICWWDGSAFKSFTDLGASELNGVVRSIDIDLYGTIAIGGGFINAGGYSNADYIAKWGGNNWRDIGQGRANNQIYKVHFANPRNDGEGNMSSGALYVSGLFTIIGYSIPYDRVAYYKSGAWRGLDIDLPGYENILAIYSASDGSLYLGGGFATAISGENAKSGIVATDNITKLPLITMSSGSANTYPIFQLHGPGQLLSIVNYSTGANVQFNDLNILEGEQININFDPTNLTFTSSWKGRGSVLRYVNAGSDYGNFYLKPGMNYISLFYKDADPYAKAFITWKPKFWGIDGALLE